MLPQTRILDITDFLDQLPDYLIPPHVSILEVRAVLDLPRALALVLGVE